MAANMKKAPKKALRNQSEPLHSMDELQNLPPQRKGVTLPTQMEPMHSLNGMDKPVPNGVGNTGAPASEDAVNDYVDAPNDVIAIIGKDEISKAYEALQRYKDGKNVLDQRVKANEQWFRMRHWDAMNKIQYDGDPKPTSAWLFNSIVNKHADAMDNFPESSVLPREESDVKEAESLSSVLPVIMEQNDFESVFSDHWWKKLKGGTGVYGVFWDNRKINGLGDVEVKEIDILNLFWEPGITDIQKSPNVFHVELFNNDDLRAQFPQLKNSLGSGSFEVCKYLYDDDDTNQETQKSYVIDWYYKKTAYGKTNIQGTEVPWQKEILHYVKFCNGTLLYASENDPDYTERGWYDHGHYPFIFDKMFPVEGSPAGFGYIDVMKYAQLYIDSFDQDILKYTYMLSHPRWFSRSDSEINETEFADWTKPIIHLPGGVDEQALRKLDIPTLPPAITQAKMYKIDELKETSGNRDFSQGGTSSGVTAASAIAALQEAGSKTSRDMLKASYRAYKAVCYMVIELIRQFYSEPRSFRIDGSQQAGAKFVTYDNSKIQPMDQGSDYGFDAGARKPLFDVKVKAYKASAFSKVAQNDLMLQLYTAQFFNPQNSDQSLACIEGMDFDGKDQVVKRISDNGTMIQAVMMMQQQIAQLTEMLNPQIGAGNETAPAPTPNGQEPKETSQKNALGNMANSAKSTTHAVARQQAANIAAPR